MHALPPGHSAEDLRGFRAVQRLAYDCAEAIAAELEPGVTEREAAARMQRWLEARGVVDWFHRPFAWFGDRTAFRGLYAPHQFYPTARSLAPGMPYILDVAPVLDGYVADIGYAGSLGPNDTLARARQDLRAHRSLILAGVRARKSFRAIYAEVDALLAQQGYDNRHRCYPFGVLAHRVDRVSGPGAGLTFGGFGLRGLGTLLRSVAQGLPAGWSPLWGETIASAHPPAPGLWAIEPHLGCREVGAKFEELLVVTPDDAYWLDDDVPHAKEPVA